ncbi:MAG: DUF1828 domain-containing protein [Hyphomicrobiaceae bacterium]|nr:DUF1828 domain-containing protein [Hyphomicrobiaceae bacterium]
MKDRICQAFCQDLSVREIDAGYAISVPYEDLFGDPIGFYAIGYGDGRYKLVDNGTTVAFLEAAGATLDSQTRSEALEEILSEYGAEYDHERGELYIPYLEVRELPRASLRFMALMLRLKDLLLMTRERVESTFREDAIAAISERLVGKAQIVRDQPVSERLEDVVPDLVLSAPDRDPVAVFLATNEQKLSEAIYLQMVARHEALVPVKVIAMLETDSSVNRNIRQRADNRLDAVPRYRRDERAAIDRIAREVVGRNFRYDQV